MTNSDIRGILLDIEGTTSPVSYVFDVLFPFARSHAERFLAENWQGSETRHALQLMARDVGYASSTEWLAEMPEEEQRTIVLNELKRLMDSDVKATGLKELQGLIWAEGYAGGLLQSEVFEDVPSTLRRWTSDGFDVRIYSSGSTGAQKVFFRHTNHGDLTACLSGYYDTLTGPKREPLSYERIAADFALPPSRIVFFSDVTAELDAARAAGMNAVLVLRPGNQPVDIGDHKTISSFAELHEFSKLA